MKTLGGIKLIGAGLLVSLNLLHAQTALVGNINGVAVPVQSTASDSIVQLTAESQGLQQVAAADLPVCGTFWLVMPGGVAAPFPCPPQDPSQAVYQIADGQFLVDSTGGQVAINRRWLSAQADSTTSMATALASEAEAVVALIDRIQTATENEQLRVLARAVGMDSLDLGFDSFGDDGGFTPSYSGGTPIDTNGLYLQITNYDGTFAYVNLNNATDRVYAVWTTTNLLTGWQVQSELWPTTDQTNVMPFSVATLGQPNLFVRAEDWTGVDSDGDGIPDWWIWMHFGNLNETATNQDSNGYTLLKYYQNGFDPGAIHFSLNLPMEAATNNLVAGTIGVIVGWPVYMAVLVNDTNLADAVWQPYNPSVGLNLNQGNGLYQVLVGLRGGAAGDRPVWQTGQVALNDVPLALTVTSPPASTVAQPVVQLQGYASGQLASLTYDVSNAGGTVSNQTGYVTGWFIDTNLQALTGNSFQCYDVALTNGWNTITLHATDLEGNTTTTNVNYTLDYAGDLTAPALTVAWPADGASIAGSQFMVEAQVGDPTATISATVVDGGGNTNKVSGWVDRDGAGWVNNLPLAAGINTLTVSATDAKGNVSTTSLTISKSSVLVTVTPPAGDLTTVSGTVSDNTTRVYVNSIQATVNSDSNWTVTGVPVNSTGTVVYDVVVYPAADTGGGGGDGGGGGGGGNNNNNTVSMRARPAANNSTSTANTLPTDASPLGEQLATTAAGPVVQVVGFQETQSGFGIYDQIHDVPGQIIGYMESDWQSAVNWTEGAGGTYQDNDVRTGYGTLTSAPQTFPTTTLLTAENPSYNMPMMHGTEGMPFDWSGTVDAKTALKTGGTDKTGRPNLFLVRLWVSDAWYDAATLGYDTIYADPAQVSVPGRTLVVDGLDTNAGDLLVTAPDRTTVELTPQTAALASYEYSFQPLKLDLQMAADNNRDGNFTPNTQVTPCRFWINDSKENGDIVSGASDQVPGLVFNGTWGAAPNSAHSQIQGRSDLVNFFPVALCLSNTLVLLPPTNGWEYHLVQNDSAVKFVYTSLTNGNAYDYLTNTASTGYGTNFSENANAADTILITGVPGVTLDTNWLAMAQTNGGNGIILVEGRMATTQPLWLEIWHKDASGIDNLMGRVPLYISISGVEQMFRQINLRSGGSPADPGVPPNYPDSLCNRKHIVFIHGFSISGEDARGENAEVFKRLYQTRSHAMFTGVDWQGDDSPWFDATGKSDYYDNVKNAFMTASNFSIAVSGLPGSQKFVIAHSLGNMVVSSAIRDFGLSVNSYFALDAAVATEAYDGNNSYLDMVNPDAFNTFEGWANYDRSLWASSWHNLFANGDGRVGLKWINRFGVIGNLFNFYSSGENVLRDSDGTYPSPLSVYSTHERAWVCQEMSKGDGLTSLTSSGSQAGWQLNVAWYIPDDPAHPIATRPRRHYEAIPSDHTDSTHINTNDLPTNPFFEVLNDSQVMDASAGSAEAAKFDVQADILAGGIPALSHATGANSVAAFGQSQNIDLMGLETKDADGNFLWPSTRPLDANQHPRWLHSDFDEVAYPFNFTLYNILVNYVDN